MTTTAPTPDTTEEGPTTATVSTPGTTMPAGPADLTPLWVAAVGGLAALALGMALYLLTLVAFAPSSPQELAQFALGAGLYKKTCAACHGQEGKGVPGLGKDMTTSAFVAGLDDAGLVAFIKAGRTADDPANTTKVPMPAMGGNPNLTDDELSAIVAHIRSLP
jgi:mono/diheme cytochrome c family protein